jgi:protein-S-isoprenylcysteine O-methyltransferase Ste14
MQSDDLEFTLLLVAQVAGAILLVVLILFWPGEWSLLRVIGLGIAAPAAVLLITARYQLGRSFSISPQARALVTSGLYAKIRNPMYVFSWFMILGFVISTGVLVLLIIPLLLIPLQVSRARKEAQVLEERFGETYRAYRDTVWF